MAFPMKMKNSEIILQRCWKCLINFRVQIHSRNDPRNVNFSRLKPLRVKPRSSKPLRFKRDARMFGDHDKDLISLGIDVDKLSGREYEENMDGFTEDDYNQVIEHGHELYDMYKSDVQKEKKIILRRILERKHFRKPPEPCLVTYAAKQQIRYLHQLDPDEWSPQLLAESFPVSVEGVKKILKSNLVMKDKEKIREHDQSVAQLWKQLMRKESIDLSPSMNQRFLEGKLSPVCAAGNASLPLPVEKPIQIEVVDRKPTGQFLAIVKPYLELKEKEREEKESEENSIAAENSDHGGHESIKSQERAQKSGKEFSGIELELSESNETLPKRHRSFTTTEKQTSKLDSELVPSSGTSKPTRKQGELFRKTNPRDITVEELKKEMGWNVSDSKKTSRFTINVTAEQFRDGLQKDLEKKKSNSEMDMIILKWLKENNKEKDLVADDSHATYGSEIQRPRNVKQYEDTGNTIELTVDVSENDSRRDSYLYDSKHGYQHPVGKSDFDLENITIPKKLYKEGAMYRKGRSYYDDTGEFLYRVPIEVEMK